MDRKIKVVQALLTGGEGGAQTYFEKMVYGFEKDPDIEQQVITVNIPGRIKRFQAAGIHYLATGNFRSEKAPHRFIQSQFAKFHDRFRIKQYLTQFDPDIIVSYHNTAPGIIRYPKAIHIARMGHGNQKKTYANCDYIVVNQPTLKHQVLAKGWPKDRIAVISNFAEFPSALQADGELPDLPPEANVLLTLGRLHPAKAQDTLIEALALLPENTHLLIAGTGKLETRLKSLTADLNLNHRVHFLGLRRDVPRLMQMADIVVLPSRYEPLGNVILEAWQAGKPIVAANSDGPRWLIEHGQNGLLFEIDDVADCAGQISQLLTHPQMISGLVAEGSSKLNRYFSKEKILNDYKTLFYRLLTERKSPTVKIS
jgi:glycosyltransferase involved in cell wall biosynthesis